MIKRLCCAPGCSHFRLEGSDFCGKHSYLQEERDRRREEHSRQFFRSRQRIDGSLYNTSRWRTERRRFLTLHQYCQNCGDEATEIHHDYQTKDYLTDEELFFNEDRWIPLCHRCHTKISNQKANRRTYEQ